MRLSPAALRRLLPLVAAICALPAAAQTFLEPKVIPTGNWPKSVFAGDFDGDGNQDLLYLQFVPNTPAGQNDTLVKIVYGDGAGNFSAPVKQGTLNASAGLTVNVGDVNGDGITDFFYAQSTSVISGASTLGIWFGNPSRALAMPPAYTTSALYLYGATATQIVGFHLNSYFRNDPTLIVLANSYAEVFTYTLGALRPVFVPKLPDGGGPELAVDVNGDGVPDLVVLGQPKGIIDVLLGEDVLGNGDAQYGSAIQFPVTGIRSFLVQDVNLDGKPDLIAEGANGHIDVYFGNGDGTFQTTSSGGTGPVDGLTGNGGHLIALGDFNHDGQLDALTSTPIGISALLGNGTQYLGLKGIYNAGPGGFGGPPGASSPTDYALADFNNDGNLDLALDSPEGIAILYGNSDGSFQTSQAYSAGQPAMSGALGVFTSSGHLDAVVSTGATQAQLLLGSGNGSFNAASAPTTPQNGQSGLWSVVQAGDLNSDGNFDILLTADGPGASLPQTPAGTQVQLGDGTGTFAPIYPLVFPYTPPGCVQSPGYLYGASTLGSAGLGAITIVRSDDGFHYGLNGNHHPPDGSGYFNNGINNGRTCGPYAHDLTVTGVFTPRFAPQPEITDLIAQANGHLYLYSPFVSGAMYISSGDLSVDGSLTTSGQLTAPALNSTFNGPAIPASSGGLGFPAFIGSMATADLDRDGSTDLVVVYANLSANLQAPSAAAPNKIYIWFGASVTSNFPTSAKHPVNPIVLTPSRNFYQVAVADMNGDSIPDLILSDGYIVSIQLGKGDGTFGAETHYLAGQGINTISAGDLRNSGHNDLVLANGGAVLTNPVANLEKLATNPDVNTGGITVLLNKAATLLVPTGVVTVMDEPSTYGSSFIISASVPSALGNPAVGGTITFFIDGVQVSGGAQPIVGITARSLYSSPNTLAVGTHTITAIYSGDANYQPATFTVTHVVAPASYSVVASPEPSVYGSSFTIVGTAPGPGLFAFRVDSTDIGAVTSTTNTASVIAPGTFAAGTHTLTLSWTGTQSALAVNFTGTHQVSMNPTSVSLVLCVDNPGSLFPCANPLGNTPLISPITFFYGQSLDGVAQESATNLMGNIVFYDGTRVFCTLTANLTGGSNVCPPQSGYFHAGSRNVYVAYTGDANNQPSTSNSVAVNVFPDLTTARLATSASPALVGTSVTFTAVLAGNYAIPVGPVNFYDGARLLGGGSLDPSGTVAFSTSTLAVGSHAITVVYAGTSDFNPVTSTVLTQVIVGAVVPPPPSTAFTLAVTPNPISVGAGATAALLVAIDTLSSAAPPVALTCSGLPFETTCSFVTAIIPAGGGATTLQLHVSAPHDCNATTPYFIGNSGGPASPVPYTFAAVFFGAFATYKRRRSMARRSAAQPRDLRSGWSGLMLVAIALFSLASLSGCGNCTDLGTRPGTYSFTVTATPQGPSTTPAQSVTIPLTVTIP